MKTFRSFRKNPLWVKSQHFTAELYTLPMQNIIKIADKRANLCNWKTFSILRNRTFFIPYSNWSKRLYCCLQQSCSQLLKWKLEYGNRSLCITSLSTAYIIDAVSCMQMAGQCLCELWINFPAFTWKSSTNFKAAYFLAF